MRRRMFVAVTVALAVAACSAPDAGPVAQESDDPVAQLRTDAALAPCPVEGAPVTEPPEPDTSLLPGLTLPCLGGGADVALRGLTGAPTVLNLWATWCAPCQVEMPVFEQAHQRAAGAVRIVGVVTQDPGLTRPLSFLVDMDVHFPSLVDDDGDLAREIAARGLPATLFVAPDGTVRHMYNGPPLTYDRLSELVSTHLGVQLDG